MRTVIALLAGLLLGDGSTSGAAYLPVIGPGPLRFQPEPAPASAPAASVLPLPAAAPVAVPVAPGTKAFIQPDADEPQEAMGTSSNAVVTTVKSPDLPGTGTETNSLGTLSMPVPPAAVSDLLTPQMLLHFFHQRFDDTKSPGTGVVIPLMFIPPQLGPWPSSKAVYTTP